MFPLLYVLGSLRLGRASCVWQPVSFPEYFNDHNDHKFVVTSRYPIILTGSTGNDQQDVIMPIEMRLARIIISEINENQFVFLREVDGDRQFPIVIGIFEATSIDRRVKDIPRPRPLTHDLLVNAVEQMGGQLDSVIIRELREHTYFADLRIKLNGEVIRIDARPSDAIAVAMTCEPPLPIFVEEEVIEEAMSAD